MNIKKAKIEKREQIIIDILRGASDINERVWERIKEKKVMSKQTFFNTRDKLVLAKKIIKHKLGRSIWLYLPEDYELFRIKANIELKETKMTLIPTFKVIDEAIEKLIKKLNRMPELNEIGVEIEEDPENPEVHSLIFARLAIVKRLKKSIEKIIKIKTKKKNIEEIIKIKTKKKNIEEIIKIKTKKKKKHKYTEKPQGMRTSDYLTKESKDIYKRMPSDEKIMDELDLSKTERHNPAIRSLIQLCKKEFKNKQIILF